VFCSVISVCVLAAPVQGSGTGGWRSLELPDAQIALELPVQPKRLETKIRADAAKLIEKQVSYEASIPGAYFLIRYTLYAENVAVDLKKAAQGAIDGIKSQAGVSEVRFTTKDVRRDDKPAVSLEGYYTLSGKHFEYDALFIGAGRQLWQVGVGFSDTSSEGKAAARRALGSIKVGLVSLGSGFY
jgi:hypothetical protein